MILKKTPKANQLIGTRGSTTDTRFKGVWATKYLGKYHFMVGAQEDENLGVGKYVFTTNQNKPRLLGCLTSFTNWANSF